MRSLQAQLTTGLVVSVVAVFALQFLAIHLAIPHLLEAAVGHKLAEDANELLTAMNLDGRKGTSIQQPDAAFVAHHFDQFYEVFIGQEKVYASPSLAGQTLGLPPQSGSGTTLRHVIGPAGNPLLLHTGTFERQGRAVHIAIGADLTRQRELVGYYLWGFSLLSVMLLAPLMLVQTWIVRNGLKALTRVREDLVKVRRAESQAVNEQVPMEVLPLVREINQLSQAMMQRLHRSREALGNFAHAFKTPLTVLAQVAGDERLHDRPEVVRTLSQQLGVLRGRVNLELKRARLAGRGGFTQPVDVCHQVRELANTIELIYRDKQLDIVCAMPDHAPFHGDREDMLELFGNLMDNACKYGRRRVRVHVKADRTAGGMQLAFEDDGPGCPPEQFDQLTRRGSRFSDQAQGDGLGLAIAAEIVASYGGRLDFARSETLGGLQVRVWLPCTQDGRS